MAIAMADAPEAAASPTVPELAARLGKSESEARETALRLYRAGILAREGDDEPLPMGSRHASSCRASWRIKSAVSRMRWRPVISRSRRCASD